MPISLYDAFVPGTRQILGSVQALLEKAEAWCAEQGCGEAGIVNASLHESMLPFSFQIKSVAKHSFGAIEGDDRLAFLHRRPQASADAGDAARHLRRQRRFQFRGQKHTDRARFRRGGQHAGE